MIFTTLPSIIMTSSDQKSKNSIGKKKKNLTMTRNPITWLNCVTTLEEVMRARSAVFHWKSAQQPRSRRCRQVETQTLTLLERLLGQITNPSKLQKSVLSFLRLFDMSNSFVLLLPDFCNDNDLIFEKKKKF